MTNHRLGLFTAGLIACLVAILFGPSTTRAQSPVFTLQTSHSGVDVVFNVNSYTRWNYTGGGGVGDFDNDGWQDLYVFSGDADGLPDRLYMNNGNGTFTDQAAAWGLTTVHKGKGIAIGDFNSDGWLDIYVVSGGPASGAAPCNHKLYRNNGNSTFTNIAVSAGVDCTTLSTEDGYGAAFGDYDLDGDLDLFVAGFASNNTGSRLFRNNGNETFTDVTDASEMFDDTPFSVAGFAPRFADMDGDRYPEILLASDFGTNRYYRNNTDGTFTDTTASSGTGSVENGMGQTIGDFNEDGLLDWYVTSIFLPTIGWTGNKLYLNQGSHVYVDDAVNAGVFDGGYGWGAVAVDFNHDTLLDIAETNGDGSGGGNFFNEQSYLWINDGDDTYTEMALSSGLSHFGKGRGMLNFDYDADGDQDLVIFASAERVEVFRNDLDLQAAGTGWLRVFLDTTGLDGVAPNGYGSSVFVTAGGKTQMRYIAPGDNFLSQSELSAHFGLGSASTVDELRVEWPDGTVTVLDDVGINQTITVSADVISPVPSVGPPGLVLLGLLLAGCVGHGVRKRTLARNT